MSENETDTTDTMAGVSHTNPYTGETAGRLFSRGPTVVTDGGERSNASRSSSERGSDAGEPVGQPAATDPDGRTDPESNDSMRDVDHTPPKGADDANRVFERGRKRPVEDAE
ncbi:hypothetical protein [Halosolutus gelatinilyticus]|uniref:hypothetical protein n=1 Tax=Halosolutus gelatinilyticus TaxID=2931975 RepID=UPI001FF50A00|nr:hypothetical protein [Halosolutus gelatinilyticus]